MLKEEEIIYLNGQGVDSFFFDPLQKAYYLLYWDGSLFNHCGLSCGTFMNWRPDGLPVKFILHFSLYSQIAALDELDDITDVNTVVEMSIQNLNPIENFHYLDDSLKEVYITNTCDVRDFPSGLGYMAMKTLRYPVNGSFTFYIYIFLYIYIYILRLLYQCQ